MAKETNSLLVGGLKLFRKYHPSTAKGGCLFQKGLVLGMTSGTTHDKNSKALKTSQRR